MSKKREIPWLSITQFHKEIVQMSQDDFFSLTVDPQNNLNSYRWTLLEKFAIKDMAGPWKISCDSITSEPLLEALVNRSAIEGYLGGPCWIDSRIENNSISDCLNPLFYRSVKLEVDNGTINIIPTEGNWDLSPHVYKILDKNEIEPETPIEDITRETIEKAHVQSDKNKQELSKHLYKELFNLVPELEKLLNSKHTKNARLKIPNYSWTFFLPPKSSSLYTHHILQDYSELEKQLKGNPSEIGGLKLLEEWPSSQKLESTELLPIVPLNDSQRMAVSEILKSKSVTVISGPPGCGKSQVVVSLLLNAWANNISVLFSSTTNAAVDVVFDRLSNFDCEYPIAIRAGSRYKSNIEESLRKILNNVSANTKRCESKQTEKRMDELVSKKNEMQAFLDGKTPQEVTEAIRSALTSHAHFLGKKREIDLERERFSSQINSIGYNLPPESFTETVVDPLLKWMEGIQKCEYQIELDSQQRIEIGNKLDSTIKERNTALQKMGLNPNDYNNFSWILTEHGPKKFESWLKAYHSILNQVLQEYLSPVEMKEEFLQWHGEKDAVEWAVKADKLLQESQMAFSRFSNQHRIINEIKNRYDDKRKELVQAGLSENANYDLEKITKWKTEYAYLSSIPGGIISTLKRKKANSRLRKIEVEIRNYYPVNIWTQFSENEQKGRKSLNEAIDKSLLWIEIQKEWSAHKLTWNEIESDFISLQSKALDLGLSQELNITDISSLSMLIKEIESKKKISLQAAEAWKTKQKADLLLLNLTAGSQEFQRLLFSNPLLDSWMNSNDMNFAKTVLSLLPSPTQENVTIAQRTLNTTRFDNFISIWTDAIETESKYQNYIRIIEQIPSDKVRIFAWWHEKPPSLALKKLDTTVLPKQDDILWNHLSECNKIASEWKECYETTLAVKIKEMRDVYEWAIKYLTVAMNKVPEPMGKEKIKSVILPLIKDSVVYWPVDDLNDLFVDFDPERIKGEIRKLDSELEILSFTHAKAGWEDRIKEERAILDSVDDLYNHYRRTREKVKDFPADKYQKALIAVPVWTTTALSPQSIPMVPEIFDILVIDEASQCTLTNILPLIYRAKRIVIIGDPDQLPAIPEINPQKEMALAFKHGVSKWLELLGHSKTNVFQIGLRCLPHGRADIILLVEHYRSHPLIIGFSNHYIYQKRLKLKKQLPQENAASVRSGIFGRNISGMCLRGNAGKSWINPEEIKAVCELIQDLRNNEGLGHLSIGVVSPFASQVAGIEKRLNELNLNSEITVGTAHKFQGDERDIIIFSSVISNGIEKGATNFANSPNLVNVALTRAREALFVVGNFKYCKSTGGILCNLVDYIDKVKLLRDTSREELELFSWLIIEGLIPQVHVMIGGIEVDFLLINDQLGVKLVIEVDGKQHYFVRVNGEKYTVKFDVNRRYIQINNEIVYIQCIGDQEFVEIQGKSYPVIQTMESIKEDDIRDEYLKGQGFRVLRVPAKAVRETPTNVITRIKEHLEMR
ncbi:MAG: AAA domain-containing protein [Methanolobus sp.]|uniref:AAA domain-containing protein n=1 Tax=Methanolobus sp. TaxID=1874737 RepID=UPI00273155DD|nr:AAA domain-containing protein [Methanolobus sp.]MDP2215783.1 AAA domain-containing protein [Methanolobus sp.]